MTILSCLLRWLFPPLGLFVLSMAFFFYFYWHAGMTDTSTLLALGAVLISGASLIACVFFVVNRISKPIQKLKEAALDIAAGDYRSTTMPVKAPEEISDLADALHTMSECVQENISRMKEDSTRSERMHGEYECALLLQQHMLHKVIEENTNKNIQLHLITHRSSTFPQGLLLKVEELKNKTKIKFYETIENNFNAIFDLLQNPNACTQHLQLNIEQNQKESLFDCTSENMPLPVIWSMRNEKFLTPQKNLQLEKGDLIFLYNHGFAKCFDHQHHIQDWFQKVLRNFAVEGMDLFVTMLNCEVNFLTRKQHIDHDINILYIQLL